MHQNDGHHSMLTQLRLAILEPTGLVGRAQRAMVEKMFGGLYPAAVQVSLVKTRLDRSNFDKYRIRANLASNEWSRPQMELLGAFVSARNGCVF